MEDSAAAATAVCGRSGPASAPETNDSAADVGQHVTPCDCCGSTKADDDANTKGDECTQTTRYLGGWTERVAGGSDNAIAKYGGAKGGSGAASGKAPARLGRVRFRTIKLCEPCALLQMQVGSLAMVTQKVLLTLLQCLQNS